MSTNSITQSRLREVLDYNPDTGIFRWKVRLSPHCSIGKKAGRINANGYHMLWVDKKSYLSHRLAWLYETGSFPEDEIDHINRNRADNRFTNLRAVHRILNMQNKKLYTKNAYGVAGVKYESRWRGAWEARIKANGTSIFLGSFEHFFDAICARKSAEREYGFHPNHGRAV